MTYFSIHNHSHFSNFRLKDSVNKPEQIIETAFEKGLSGIVLSDHETIAGAVEFWNYYQDNKERLGDFKVGIGNEIYLLDRSTLDLVENNESVKYHHFLLLAKNQRGIEFLKRQSSMAWSNAYHFRGMERVPTYYDELRELMKDYKGDIIASSACIGGQLPQYILSLDEAVKNGNKDEEKSIRQNIHGFILYMQDVFGLENFYLELQPSNNGEQLVVNDWLLKIGKSYGIKCIITTDAHYLDKSQAEFHKNYLTAQEGEREVEAFYATTYIFSHEELLEYFDEDVLKVLIDNTNEIKAQMEPLEFKQTTKIPVAHIPEYEMSHLFDDIDKEKYPYIYEMKESESDIDRYYAHLCAVGLVEKNETINETTLGRINVEFGEILAISKQLGQAMSSYFVVMKELVDLMWTVSLVGPGRGSAACFYTNYLLSIVEVSALDYDLPHWRFLSKERVELPDIDVDAESSKRAMILDLIKDSYGHLNVLNIGTYTTEGARSASLTACRSLGIDPDTAQNITNMIPRDGAVTWDLKDALLGNEKKERKPNQAFVAEVNQYEGLQDLMIQTQGLVSGRGSHASGLVIFPDGYVEQNAMMKTSSSKEITQFDANDTEFMGGLKYDTLSIVGLDRIRAAMDLLLAENQIEWQGDLRSTYNKYFHPKVLEMQHPDMFEMLFKGEVIAAFQFETIVGRVALEKVKAKTFDEIAAANSLMRLSSEDSEQPIDKFVRYKNNPNEWEQDMINYGLTKDERKVLHEVLDSRYGVCDTQELLMILSMRPEISNFDLTMANKLRKSIAKKDEKMQEAQRVLFFEECQKNGTSTTFADYVWHECFSIQKG